MATTSSLKNINFMSQSKYDSITPADDELYAVELNVVETSAMSKSSDGYVKFSNGLIIQWGTINTPNRYTFSTPFTLTPRVVVARVNSSATNGTRTPVAHSVSTTGFTAYWYNSESLTFNWIAIGC